MKYFIDAGGHVGESITLARRLFGNDIKIISFEANPALANKLYDKYKNDPNVFISSYAVWYRKERLKLFFGYSSGSSLNKDKTSGNINEDDFTEVEAIDFPGWLLTTFNKDDEIFLKLNVEGSEFNILEDMIANKSIHLVDKIFIHWHVEERKMKNSKEYTKRMNRILGYVYSQTDIKFHDWTPETISIDYDKDAVPYAETKRMYTK